MKRSRSKSTHVNSTGKTARSSQFLKDLGLKLASKNRSIDNEKSKILTRKITKEDLHKLMELDAAEINYIIKRISHKRRIHLMKLLENANSLEDSFEFILSRKVSAATEFEEIKEMNKSNDLDEDEGYLNTEQVDLSKNKSHRVFSKPPWVDESTDLHEKLCSRLAGDSFGEIKAPKSRKKRAMSKIIDENPFHTL